MGDWSLHEFGQVKLPKRCFVFAGTTPEFVKNEIVNSYSEVIFHKHDVYERFIVRKKGETEEVLIFQAYGAAVIADLLAILKDGEVEEIIFIGTAFGLSKDLSTGDVIIPTKVQCLDGVTNILANTDYVVQNNKLKEKIINRLIEKEISFKEGLTVSVPTTFWKLDGNKFDKNIIALEMELSAFIHFTFKLGLDSVGLLIISDTINHSLLDDQTIRFKSIVKTFCSIK